MISILLSQFLTWIPHNPVTNMTRTSRLHWNWETLSFSCYLGNCHPFWNCFFGGNRCPLSVPSKTNFPEISILIEKNLSVHCCRGQGDWSHVNAQISRSPTITPLVPIFWSRRCCLWGLWSWAELTMATFLSSIMLVLHAWLLFNLYPQLKLNTIC